MDYSYASFVQRLLVEEQLRRDLAAQEWMVQTRQVAASNAGNAGMYEAANALANSRINPSLSRRSFVGNKHHLSTETNEGPPKKKAKFVPLPRFTSREGRPHSFPLPHPAVERVFPILNLVCFQAVWDRLKEESTLVTDSSQKLAFAKERFARHVIRFDATRTREKLELLTAQSKDASGVTKRDPTSLSVRRERKVARHSRP